MKRQVLGILFLSVMIALLGIGIIVPVMPVFAVSLGAGGLALGLIIAAFSITRAILQPVVGSYSDRYGKKRFMVIGLLIYSLVGIILPQADSVAHLILIRAFHGVGSAMIVPVAMAYVGDMAPVGQEGRYMSMLNIAIFLGIGGGPLFGGLFSDVWGMASAFYAMAGLSFTAFLLVLFYMPVVESKEAQDKKASIFGALNEMLGNRRTIGILLARMSTMMIMVPTMAFLPLLMNQWFAASGIQIGMVIACRTFVNVILQTPAGKMADRYNKVTQFMAGSLIVSLVLFLIPVADDFWNLMILFAVLGLGEAVIWPVLGALATEDGRYYGQGTMMGAYTLAMSVGIFFGALGSGISVDLFGLQLSFSIISVIVLLLTITAASLIVSGVPVRMRQKDL